METEELWREDAACRDTVPDIFYQIGKNEPHLEAKTICKVCPVDQECLEYALRTNQQYGVWGGYTEEERRRLRRGLYTLRAKGFFGEKKSA